MIKGDAGMESIYTWSEHTKRESFRGASGGGDGVHVLTGPIAVDGAEPGDVLKVEIVDLRPRANPDGKTYGSNANAFSCVEIKISRRRLGASTSTPAPRRLRPRRWWGFQARVPKADGSSYDAGAFTSTPGSNDEVITIYELASDDAGTYATPVRVQVAHAHGPRGRRARLHQIPWHLRAPRPRATTRAVAPKAADIEYMDELQGATPPTSGVHGPRAGVARGRGTMPSGGNLDDKRIGVGTTMDDPVEVAGALLSMGDAHTRAETVDAASALTGACRAGSHGAGPSSTARASRPRSRATSRSR